MIFNTSDLSYYQEPAEFVKQNVVLPCWPLAASGLGAGRPEEVVSVPEPVGAAEVVHTMGLHC
jgi:hypothetical protein